MASSPAHPVSRRSFLNTGLGLAVAAAVAPQVVSSRVLGQNSPSKRVTLGFIGVGAHGFGVNLKSFLQLDDCQVVAVCDVWPDRMKRARDAVNEQYGNNDCAMIADFRALLARKDIDAVVISTPDHWHVTMSLMALAAGKPVLCEKPTLTIEEGRRLATAVKKSGLLFATALEDRAVQKYHMLAEAVRNGAIGKLQRIHVGLPEKPVFPKEDPVPVPAGFNYELWLGPAPYRPYSPTLTDAQVWRQIREFSAGSLTDWGAHLVDTAQVANFAEESGPVAVKGTGVIPTNSINTVPQTYHLEYEYKNGVTLDVKSGQVFIRLEGSDGWVSCQGWEGQMDASNREIFRRKYDPKTNKIWPRRPREQRDFLDCLKNGQPPMYTAEALHRLSSALHIGAISLELGRPVKWDPVKETFKGDKAANALRSRSERKDWQRA